MDGGRTEMCGLLLNITQRAVFVKNILTRGAGDDIINQFYWFPDGNWFPNGNRPLLHRCRACSLPCREGVTGGGGTAGETACNLCIFARVRMSDVLINDPQKAAAAGKVLCVFRSVSLYIIFYAGKPWEVKRRKKE